MTHFWYSNKQADCYRKFKHFDPMTNRLRQNCKNYANIDGKTVLYTMCNSKDKEHGSNWDDIIYLGEGEYSHSKGYW